MAERELDLWSFMQGIDSAMVGTQKTLGMYPRCKFCDSYNVVRNGSRSGIQYYLLTTAYSVCYLFKDERNTGENSPARGKRMVA